VYASISNVEALNSARTFTAISKPSKSDVEDFLAKTAAKLDGLVRARGYVLPVPTTATSALELLSHFNAIGAHAYAERSAVSSPHKDAAWEAWMECLKELREGEVDLGGAGGIPIDSSEGWPRGRFVPTPFFSVDMAL